MAKIMVVGGAGYIGCRLVPYLITHGHDVTVIDALWFGYHLPIKIPLQERDASTLKISDFVGFDQVVFLAGMSNDPMADFDPSANFVANGATPVYVAAMAARAGVKRFIHGSSCSVYGLRADTVDEKDPPRTYSPYGVGKFMAECGINQYADQMDVINLRQGTVAGWSPRMRFDLMINAMVCGAITQGVINVNDAQARRPLFTLDDVCSAYRAVIEFPGYAGGTYNVLSVNGQVGQIAYAIQEEVIAVSDKRVTLVSKNQRDIRSYTASNVAFCRKFDWLPQGTIRAAALDVLSHMPHIADPTDAKYYNIRMLKDRRSPLAA